MRVRSDIRAEDAVGVEAEVQEDIASVWMLVWWRFRKHRLAVVCGFLLVPFLCVMLFSEFFSTHDPEESNTALVYVPPQPIHFFDEGRFSPFVYAIQGRRNARSLRMEWSVDTTRKYQVRFLAQGYAYRVLYFFPTRVHLIGVMTQDASPPIYLFGTDQLGRDVWSRCMYGTRISLSVGWVGVLLSLVLGVFLGGISGYFGGIVDLVIQRVIEFLQSLPTIPLWLALTAALPHSWSPLQVYMAISIILSIVGWTTLGREVRGQFLALREADFVRAAQLVGSGELRIILVHIVPACTSHIITVSTFTIAGMILNETALSFLGLGLRPPIISWGVLLHQAQNLESIALAPWLLYPGFAVVLVVLALNIIGDGLRDAADPYANR